MSALFAFPGLLPLYIAASGNGQKQLNLCKGRVSAMTDTDKMLVKQFLLRVRQEGFSIVENPPRHLGGINIDIYRGKTKICTFDDRHLGENCSLRVYTDDSTRPEIKEDYHKLFYTFIHLRDLYAIYEAAEPLKGYNDSLGYRAIIQHNNYVLAVNGRSILGELEFSTFRSGKSSYGGKTICDNTFFDMDAYPAAKLDFVSRSGLLPKEQLITPDNIVYMRVACVALYRDNYNDEGNELKNVITDLHKAEESFREVEHRISAIPAKDAQYIDARILTVKGIFTKQQIDRATLPKGLYAYDIQYSRDDMKPEALWNSVLGCRFGTIITKRPLTIGEKGYTEIKDTDLTLNPAKRPALRDFQFPNREAR